MKRSQLKPGAKSLERGSTFENDRSELRSDPETARAWRDRSNDAARERERGKPRRAISPASSAQRDKTRLAPCVRCKRPDRSTPAHLIDRSLGGDDDPRAVVPLCLECHRLYDDGRCDLLPFLEPHYRAELAYAVELVGLVAALNRITNDRYEPRRAA